MAKETADDILGAMIALSPGASAISVQEATRELATIVHAYEKKMGLKATRKLLLLGASLWATSQRLGEDVLEIHHISSAEQ